MFALHPTIDIAHSKPERVLITSDQIMLSRATADDDGLQPPRIPLTSNKTSLLSGPFRKRACMSRHLPMASLLRLRANDLTLDIVYI